MSTSLSDPGPAPDRTWLALAVVIGLVAVAVIAVAVAVYVVVQATAGEDGAAVHASEEWDPSTFPVEIADVDAFTAVPGDTFESREGGFSVVNNVQPGIYIAPDAAPRSVAGGKFCNWAVTESEDFLESSYVAFGQVEDGTAMMLVPAGYWLQVTPQCGTWEAIEPDQAFVGAEGTVMTDAVYHVGRDVVPGAYASTEPVLEDSMCTGHVDKQFGFEGRGYYADVVYPRGGTLLLRVEAGDVVQLQDCPPFELFEPDKDNAADAAAESMDNGAWLVGTDVVAGTYVSSGEVATGFVACSASVSTDSVLGVFDESFDKASHREGEQPSTIAVEVGDVVEVRGCGTWELVAP